MTGQESLWEMSRAGNLAGSLFVGAAGQGVLDIRNGGRVTNEFTSYLGHNATSSREVAVSGQGSR